MIKKSSLSLAADIRFGVHLPPSDSGVPYLQVKQFDAFGILTGPPEEFVSIQRSDEAYLKDGDVLFVGKGTRLFSWCYRVSSGEYAASSSFFILRPNTEIAHPEYLATILNAPSIKSQFFQIGAGTNIFSIRKSELAAFQIPLPPLEQQRKIAAIAELHRQELQITKELLEHKTNLYAAVISKLIK